MQVLAQNYQRGASPRASPRGPGGVRMELQVSEGEGRVKVILTAADAAQELQDTGGL